jgi:hypothetical protein
MVCLDNDFRDCQQQERPSRILAGSQIVNRGRARASRPASRNPREAPYDVSGKPYYPAWLDNLADDVTLEMDATAHGAEDVRTILVTAREQYQHQEFNYAGPCGVQLLEDYTSSVRGLRVIVLVNFNAAGKAQRLVVNHRPRSALLLLSRAMLERFAGTPLAKHWEGTP